MKIRIRSQKTRLVLMIPTRLLCSRMAASIIFTGFAEPFGNIEKRLEGSIWWISRLLRERSFRSACENKNRLCWHGAMPAQMVFT